MDKEMTFKIEINQINILDQLTKRAIKVPEDIPAIVSLVNTSNEFDKIDERETVEGLTNHFMNLKNCDLEADSIALEADGKLIGFGRNWWKEETDGTLVYGIYIDIHPDWRNQGIGTHLQKSFEKRISEISSSHDPEKPKKIRIGGMDTQKNKFEIAKKFGFKEDRFFFEMTRDLSLPIPDPVFPDNIEIRPVLKEHYRKIWEAEGEAFKEHWGFVKPDEKDYQAWVKRIEDVPEFEPEIWKVAWDGDQIAGMVLNFLLEEENRILNIKRGWTEDICVLPNWRKKGLASALINESMHMFKEMSMEETALGVDTDNALNALSLYKNCGYKATNTWVFFQKPLN